jgi:hypothetical protein
MPESLARRRFLRSLLLAPVVGTLAVWRFDPVGLTSRIRKPFQPRLRNSPRGSLRDDEFRNIAAFGEVLIPVDDTPGADEAWVRDYVDRQTTARAGWLEEYRSAANLLDRLASEAGQKEPFSTLPFPVRDRIVSQNFPGNGTLAQWTFDLSICTAAGRQKMRAWTLVARDLIDGFYGSPGGWAVIGYTNYPGTAAQDPRGYTQPVRLHA